MSLKQLYIMLAFCFVFENTQAQQKIDSSFLSSYYMHKVSQFRLLPNTENEIVFLGDSITDIAEWSELFGNQRIKNRGISTDNTFGVIARLDEVVASHPNKIFLMIGINDIAKKIPDSIIVNNIQRIVILVRQKSPKTKIFIQSILPTNNEFLEFSGYQNKDEHIQYVNEQINKLCKKEHLYFVNLYPIFLDEYNKLSKQFTSDGLHLNGDGYMLWKKVLIENKLL
jgi:lysophospholipase L1-like esterase